MGDVGACHITRHEHGVGIMRADCGIEHCPASARTDNLEVPRSNREGHSQKQNEKNRVTADPCHLILSFTFDFESPLSSKALQDVNGQMTDLPPHHKITRQKFRVSQPALQRDTTAANVNAMTVTETNHATSGTAWPFAAESNSTAWLIFCFCFLFVVFA